MGIMENTCLPMTINTINNAEDSFILLKQFALDEKEEDMQESVSTSEDCNFVAETDLVDLKEQPSSIHAANSSDLDASRTSATSLPDKRKRLSREAKQLQAARAVFHENRKRANAEIRRHREQLRAERLQREREEEEEREKAEKRAANLSRFIRDEGPPPAYLNFNFNVGDENEDEGPADLNLDYKDENVLNSEASVTIKEVRNEMERIKTEVVERQLDDSTSANLSISLPTSIIDLSSNEPFSNCKTLFVEPPSLSAAVNLPSPKGLIEALMITPSPTPGKRQCQISSQATSDDSSPNMTGTPQKKARFDVGSREYFDIKPSTSVSTAVSASTTTANYATIKKVRIHKRADYVAEERARNQVVLRSCLKKSDRNPAKGRQRVDYALDRTTIVLFEIAEGNILRPIDENKVDYARITTKFTKIARKKTKIFKKMDSRAMRMRMTGDLENLLQIVRFNRDNSYCKGNLFYSRWLITDGLLSDLNERVFKNMVVTRLEYPMNPSWLITHGLRTVTFDFEVSYIIVACGIQFYENDYSAVTATTFLRDMHAWISTSVSLKQISREKSVYVTHENAEDRIPLNYSQGIPVLVAVTVPEVGPRATIRKEYNNEIHAFVQNFNNCELERARSYGAVALPIELLDWAQLYQQVVGVKVEPVEEGDAEQSSNDFLLQPTEDKREAAEKRVEILMNELQNSFGVLIR